MTCHFSGRKSSTNGDSSNLEDNLDPTESDFENSATNSTELINDAINQSLATRSEPNAELSNKNKQNGPCLFDCVWPSKPIGLSELQSLRSAILISIAYVSLCLKDYSSTIRYCNSLLSEQEDFLNSKFPVSKGNK